MTPARHAAQSLTAVISRLGQRFEFRLCTRPLMLGPYGEIQYYWMDSSRFRLARGRDAADPINLRGCLWHWWRTMQSAGLSRDPVQLAHLVLAANYPTVSRANSLQRVYRDAHLRPGATSPQDRSLADADRDRCRGVARSRDRARVREELTRRLGMPDQPADQADLAIWILDGMMGHDVDVLLKRGIAEGLPECLERFDDWWRRNRRQGGRGLLPRGFLDRIAYQCKISFYLCYTNAWIGLIPWLREHRGLDDLSERFLRLWHCQNQPVERPDGSWEPDVFCGQVLALHPLSGFFMKDPALLAVAGRFLASEGYVALEAGAECGGEYWDLVEAILTAACLYRQARDEQDQRRAPRESQGEPDSGAITDTDIDLLQAFAEDRDLRCRQCGGKLRVSGSDCPGAGGDSFELRHNCSGCGSAGRLTVGRPDLENWLGIPH